MKILENTHAGSRITLLLAAAAMMFLSAPDAAGNIYSNGYLSIRSMTVEQPAGKGWKESSDLVRNRRYRLRFEIVNSAPGGAGYCVAGCKEIYYDDLNLEITPSTKVHCFAFDGDDSRRFVASLKGKKLARYTRTKDVVVVDAGFTWRCANTALSNIPAQHLPKVNLNGLQSEYLRNDVTRVLAPSRKPVELGARCSVNGDCSSGRCDAGIGTKNTRRCIPNDGAGNEGDYCNHDNQCAYWAYCSASRCTRTKQAGASCSRNRQCAGLCDLAPGNPRRCIPPNGLGSRNEYCTHNNQCDARKRLVCRISAGRRTGRCNY